MTATPRQWSAFVDNVNPRIVMTAERVANDGHWSLMTLDEERSTTNVTVWLGGDGEPAMIEADGEGGIRVLEHRIGETVYLSDREVAGSPTLDCLSVGRWIWRHGGLVVSRDEPPGLHDGPGPFTAALEQVRENEERRARRLR